MLIVLAVSVPACSNAVLLITLLVVQQLRGRVVFLLDLQNLHDIIIDIGPCSYCGVL